MKKIQYGMVQALKDHLLIGNPITRLEAIVLFGVSGLNQTVSRLRKDGWTIESQRVPYAKALTRINAYAELVPPQQLPIKEIQLTEYWLNK